VVVGTESEVDEDEDNNDAMGWACG